ncbi:lyase family protein, partial [Vibrio parahaemolyticus V-223/04]
RLAIPD